MTRSGPQTMLATKRFGKWNMRAFGFGVCRPSALLMVKPVATSRSYGYLLSTKEPRVKLRPPKCSEVTCGLRSDWLSALLLQGSPAGLAPAVPPQGEGVLTGPYSPVRSRGSSMLIF